MPLRRALYLLRGWRVLARLVVRRPTPTRLELGERVQGKPRLDGLDHRRHRRGRPRRRERVSADPNQHPVKVRVECHHPVGEAVDPYDPPVGVSGRRAGEEVGLRPPRRRGPGADAPRGVDEGVLQADQDVVGLRRRDREDELLDAAAALLPAEIQYRIEIQRGGVTGGCGVVVPRPYASGPPNVLRGAVTSSLYLEKR
jgi:hypothetical protein